MWIWCWRIRSYLRRVLEHRPYRGMPVVLLHECYPYTRQGGYLAAVYENVYLDLSYGDSILELRRDGLVYP